MQFMAFAAVLQAWGGKWFLELRQGMRYGLEAAFAGGPPATQAMELSRYLLLRLLVVLGPAAVVLLLATLGMQLVATRLGVSLKKLMPDFKRLNPLGRIKELPRQNLPALAKAVIMLPLFGFAVYGIIRDNVFAYMSLPYQSVESGFRQACSSFGTLIWKGAAVFLIFGCVDLFRQKTPLSTRICA